MNDMNDMNSSATASDSFHNLYDEWQVFASIHDITYITPQNLYV